MALWLFDESIIVPLWLLFHYLFNFLKGCCQIFFAIMQNESFCFHHALWPQENNLQFSKPRVLSELSIIVPLWLLFHYVFHFLKGCCQMQAFVSIMHYDLKKKIFIFSKPGVLSELLFSLCIMSSKNPYFSNQGCCLSCCSHALWSQEKNLHFFQAQGAVWAVVLIMHNELKKNLLFSNPRVLFELLF